MDQGADATTTGWENPLLCSGCQAWNNAGTFFEQYPKSFTVVQGPLDNVPCIVCKAAMEAIAARISHMGIPQTSWVIFRNDGPFYAQKTRLRMDTSDPEEGVVRLFMSLRVMEWSSVPTLPTEDEIEPTQFEMTPQFRLRFRLTGAHKMLRSVEPWEAPFFDISLLKQWIRDCTERHGAACKGKIRTRTAELPQGFRVINLSTMNVEEPTTVPNYVALSYMWPSENDSERVQLEKSNLDALEQPGGLAKIALPPIIMDAILLCKQLGENFLWIDRLCIVQDDSSSKHNQIRGMDRIYHSASLTIMAALNDRDIRGLPGLFNQPRVSSIYRPNYELQTEGRLVKSVGLSAVEMSVWNTRGWTFQERVLSTRRLYITEHQVLFECPLGYESEVDSAFSPRLRADFDLSASEERDAEDQLGELGKWSENHNNINYHITSDASARDYLQLVTNYTSRRLSVDSDILNAFAGISGIFGQMIGCDFIFGLPEKFLLQGLMWRASDAIGLRHTAPEVPSWSWASCPSKVDYEWMRINERRYFGAVELSYFHFHDPEEGLRRVKVQELWMDKKAPSNGLEYDVSDHREACINCLPRWKINPDLKEYCIDLTSQMLLHTTLAPEACRVASTLAGALVFNTRVATLILDPPNVNERNLEGGLVIRSFMNGLSPEYCERHDSVGSIYGPFPRGLNAEKLAEKKQEIIFICGALHGKGLMNRRRFSPIFITVSRLHVMLIERDEASPFIARRVGVGYVQAHLWDDLPPRWETVVLC